MVLESIFMIRGGAMGFNFDTKLILGILSLVACAYDWRVHHCKDYTWVFLVGTLICAGFEVLIQLSGNRDMGDKYLFGIVIPLWVSIPIQGMAEGGFVAIVSIFFGDFLADVKVRKVGIIAFAVAIAAMVIPTVLQGSPAPNVGGDVPSRRNIFAPASLAFMIVVIIINLVWFRRHSGPVRTRAAYMILTSIIFFATWTFNEWAVNTRWIEVGTIGGYLARAPPAIEFLALAWDVVVEITLVFMLAYFIPYRLNLIKREDTDPAPVAKD